MSSKKSKKPDQEIYRPPKSDRQTNYENNGDKSHERTFYNSNHKKKPPPSKSADNSSSNNKDLEKSKKSIDEKYESDYGYYKQSAAAAGVYPTRHWKYRTDNCYSGEQKWNTNPIDNNHYWNNRYKNEEENYYYEYCYGNEYEDEYEGYGGGRQGGGRYRGVQATAGGQRGNYERSGDARRGRASFGAGKKAVGDSGTGAGGGREKKEGKTGKQAGGYGDKKRHHNHHQRQPHHQQQHQQSQQSHEIAGDERNTGVSQGQGQSAGRTRCNSYNKDFTDSRLFNPYKHEQSDGGGGGGTVGGGGRVGRFANQIGGGGSSVDARDKPEGDSHIHGGLIHLPDNLDIKQTSGVVSHVVSPAMTSAEIMTNTKSSDNKPTVMVRPTFSHVTSNSTPYPTVSLMHGIQTISGFIPVQPTFITPGTINLIRAPPQTLTTPHIMSPLRFTSQQIVHTPDDSGYYSIPNIVSKSPVVCQCVNQIKTLEIQLDGLVRSSCDITSSDWWQSVNNIRSELMDLYRSVIINDLDFCNQAGIEQNLWKSVFYSIMELIRTYISNPENAPVSQNVKDQATKIKCNILNHGQNILQTGEEYFISIFSDISKFHSVDLEVIFESRRPPPETGSRTRKLVYLSAQKLLLFLGDLARYSEMINNTCDYSKARIWYLKAQLLVPKNGRPYNQLAVISVYANRHLDALYYYTRTLAASNPFPTASQSLSFLFEETRKYDETMRRQQESIKRKKKKQNITSENRKKGCIEIWIHPDDGTKEKKVTDDDDADILATFDSNDDPKQKVDRQVKEDYISMPLIELHKLFTLSFLNSHGKLFGKINMENFPEVCSTMLQELWALLCHQPCPLSSYRLCHILIINMYIMDRVSQQMPVVNNFALRSLHQDHASRMTLDFFALLCQRAIEIFDEWTENEPISNIGPLQLPPDLSTLLPPLCLWTDWMVTHPEYWNPLPSHRDPLLLPSIDDFGLISELCTKVSRLVEKSTLGLSRPRYRVISDNKEADKAISNKKTFVLLEENLISGFLPMLDQIPKIYLLEDEKWSKEQTDDWIHLEKISLFGDFLCGINPPLLDYNVDTCTYVPTVIKEGSERQQDGIDSKDTDEIMIDDIEESDEELEVKLKKEIDEINITHGNIREASNEQTSWADLTEQAEEEEREHQRRIAQLKIKRANLKFKEEKNRRFELWRKSLLDHEIAQRFVELEIRPLFLVLDTNCYIDYLPNIKLLINHKKYIVVVPLIVVNELENLSKSYQPKDDVNIHDRAKKALVFLEDKFEKGDQYVRAITSRGTFMETIAYRAEALNWVEGETNDDVILNCCQYLCKDKPSDFMPREKDKPITLHRDVVLLTGDRNLRLKALSRHIPVKPLMKFMEWAYIKRKFQKK